MSESYLEKRQSPRREVEIEAKLSSAGDAPDAPIRQVIILNISEGGIFIKTDNPPQLKDRITCEFIWPDTERPCRVTGTVLWRKLMPPRGVGIELSRINDRPISTG